VCDKDGSVSQSGSSELPAVDQPTDRHAVNSKQARRFADAVGESILVVWLHTCSYATIRTT